MFLISILSARFIHTTSIVQINQCRLLNEYITLEKYFCNYHSFYHVFSSTIFVVLKSVVFLGLKDSKNVCAQK